jgi:thiol-disulfide isomerase/thioredoxin
MSRREYGLKKGARPEWKYYDSVKTGADGTIRLKYERLGNRGLIIHDPANRRMAIASLSPRAVLGGEVAVTLKPECRMTGVVVSEQLKKIGKPVGWTNVYLMQDGRRVADSDSHEGKFEFVVPPGRYELDAYGSDVKGKHVWVTVPAGRKEFTAGPINLAATNLALLQGKPAPELKGVVAWRGKEVKLADLRGKYVLLEFWGYWCGPCVQARPVLIELHVKFADKGLVIVGIHLDSAGEVDTVAKLNEKIAGFRKKLWKGKDLPFPVALTSGKSVGEDQTKNNGGPAGQYGIYSFPTTVLIDRDGKVVGKFQARDIKTATREVEKLLREKK